MILLCDLLDYDAGDDEQNVAMISRWHKIVAEVLVLMFPEGWPRAWHGTGVLPVAVFHANS